MQKPKGQALYQEFVSFVSSEMQRERDAVNKRMRTVFFWCFLVPTLGSIALLFLVKLHILPSKLRSHLDWFILIFPVAYSLYFLGAEVLREVPKAIRRGGVATTLSRASKEGEWRESVTSGMRKNVPADPQEWRWIIANFKMDLEAMQYRNRYLTALAGAVFFLIMQGIDSISDTDKHVSLVHDSFHGWIDAGGSDPAQFVGLALFLVLLYLSGSQSFHSLQRYLNCARLLILEHTPDRRSLD